MMPRILGMFSSGGSFYITNGQVYDCPEPFVLPEHLKQSADIVKYIREYLSNHPKLTPIEEDELVNGESI